MIRSINAFRALALCAGLIPAAALAQDNNGGLAGGTAPQKATTATTLAAGGLFGGFPKNQANCVLYNAGNSAVSFARAEIVQQGRGPVPLAFNNCNVALATGSFCAFGVDGISVGGSFAGGVFGCKVVFSPDSKLVRGNFEIFNSGTVLENVELR